MTIVDALAADLTGSGPSGRGFNHRLPQYFSDGVPARPLGVWVFAGAKFGGGTDDLGRVQGRR
jgi:hypothetical protein